MACPNCGSWAVKADRSLSGRMVCARCGQVLGRQMATGQGRRSLRGPSLPGLGRHWRPWLGIGLLVVVSALLASLPPRGRLDPRPASPPARSGEPLTRGPGPSVVAIR